MLENDLFSKYYNSKDEYQLLLNWLTAYFDQYGQGGNRAFLLYPEFPRLLARPEHRRGRRTAPLRAAAACS
jgi:hypothetical protein